jgi:hypothetical protein
MEENKKEYYVYIYLDQTKEGEWFFRDLVFKYQPFYVGKGVKNRDKSHLLPYNLKRKSFKNSIIKSIKNKIGEEPIHYRIYENLTNDEAINLEIEIIKHFGRRDILTGILSNGTDGGDGANNFSSDILKKTAAPTKKVYQYSLNGEFIKEWESIKSVDVVKTTNNISGAIKRNGTVGGFIWSYEFKDKLEPKIRYQMPIKFSDIQQIDKETNQVIKTFDTALQIEKELGLINGSRNKIYDCLRGKLKTAYGYKWKIKWD